MSSNLNSHFVTGQAPPQKVGYVAAPVQKPVREKIDQWYLEPLRAMNGDDAFVCLAVCFLLYEKYLRLTGAMPEDQNFTQGHKVFELVGKQINADPNIAFLIWNSWRNGLLHRAMPKEKENVQWALDGKLNVPVKSEKSNLTLNPWLLRDRILDVVQANRGIWKDTQAPLMDVYEITPLK
jgi:hypothetical protein